ncbi:hypothetical protein [Thermoactinomyces sp. DSM 45892]|nr:hypothetical protein [Thermoactinomyces sp. DSM 45892]
MYIAIKIEDRTAKSMQQAIHEVIQSMTGPSTPKMSWLGNSL